MIKKISIIVILLLLFQLNVLGYVKDTVLPLPMTQNQWENFELGSGEFANGGLRLKGKSGVFILKDKIAEPFLYGFKSKFTLDKASRVGIFLKMQVKKGMPWDNYNSGYLFEFLNNRVSLIKYIAAEKTVLATAPLTGIDHTKLSNIVVGSRENGETAQIFLKINDKTLIHYNDTKNAIIKSGYFGFYSLDGGEIAVLPLVKQVVASGEKSWGLKECLFYGSIILACGSLVFYCFLRLRGRKRQVQS